MSARKCPGPSTNVASRATGDVLNSHTEYLHALNTICKLELRIAIVLVLWRRTGEGRLPWEKGTKSRAQQRAKDTGRCCS